MKRRSRIGIIADILHAASKGASRTRIMYRANLNFSRFEKYFEELLDKELIERTSLPNARGCPIYKITEKAQAIIEELERLDQHIGIASKNNKKRKPWI